MKRLSIAFAFVALLIVISAPVVLLTAGNKGQASAESQPADAEKVVRERPLFTWHDWKRGRRRPPRVTSPPRPLPPTATTPTSTTPTSTTRPTTTTSMTTPPPPNPGGSGDFFEDFADGGSQDRFEFGLYHRDDFVNADNTSWIGDHAPIGPDDRCGPPEEQRVITRGERAAGFNDEWHYRCVPGGDRALAHLMTAIGDTSGYSIGAFTPRQIFTDVRAVRWDLNITELGNRQFPEVKIIPAANFDFQNLPCAIEWLPCLTNHHVNGVDTETLTARWGEFINADDPAIDSIRTRRTHVLRDNGDGTLSFAIEQQDGTFLTVSRPGSFPGGPVRVVFADHNYTPLKAENGRPSTFTWHWDDITVLTR